MGERPYCSVSVSINGEQIVCIEPGCLSGDEEKTTLYEDVIREAAEHLRAFIGDGVPSPCFACGDTGMERWVGHGGTEEVAPCSVCQSAHLFPAKSGAGVRAISGQGNLPPDEPLQSDNHNPSGGGR